MATIDTPAPASDDHAHDHHDHDHPAWLAHHFDTPEQQFDSGKLGIWLFLVTEVLFFSGMFCAYAIFRMLNPEVFVGCSQFLNTKLGAINTGVLLFSSLTMAWAVRCSQTEEHKKLVAMLATTLSCAMIFLGVKAIEYSHKWGMGLLPPGTFFYDPANPHPEGSPPYLLYLCIPFGLAAIGVIIWALVAWVSEKKFQFAVAKPLVVVCLCFFVGVGLGQLLESGETSGTHEGESHASAAHLDGDGHGSVDHQEAELDDHTPADLGHSPETAASLNANDVDGSIEGELSAVEVLAQSDLNTGARAMVQAQQAQSQRATGKVTTSVDQSDPGIEEIERDVMTKRQAGVFFGIYYCMTGIHAIHILAGIGVLVWLLVRAVRQDFNRQYFGPVDYVGLYWHLVDLIWIYLFPLLYLIR